jgi:tetratricopeptide (TPR) repeat protein
MRRLAIYLTFAATLGTPVSGRSQSSPDELYLNGIESYNEGRFEEAIGLLRRAATLRPNVPDYRYSLGLAYLKGGRAKDAARELEAVRGMIGMRRETRVKEPEVLLHAATAYIQLDRLRTARKRLEAALRADPEYTEALYSLGIVEQREGHQEKAVESFRAVLAVEPDHPDANLAMAESLRHQGRETEVLERLRHAAHGAPADVGILLALGSEAFEQGEIEEAEQAFRQAMAIAPESPEIAFSLGTVLISRQAYEEAIKLLEPLESADSPYDGASYNLAQAYRSAGRDEDAARALENLLRRSPEYPEANFVLGIIRESLGDSAGAEEAYRKEIELAPLFIPAYVNLAVLLENDARAGEALEVLEAALRNCTPEDEALRGQIEVAIAAMKESRP